MDQSHETIEFNKNEMICRQGEKADCLYVLRRGSVGVYINPESDNPLEDQILSKGVLVAAVDDEGEFIGEGGLFLESRGASLVALSDGTRVEQIPLPGNSLRQIMLEQPAIAMKLCRSLAERVRDIDQRLRKVLTAGDSVNRSLDQFSITFSDLLKEAERKASSVPNMQDIVADFHESPLNVKGRSLLEQRRETTLILNQAASQQRSGTLRLEEGEVLCEEGKMGRALYLVREGELVVHAGSAVIGHVGPNEIVGEIAVLLKELPKRTATVRASRPTMLNCIPAVKFHKLAQENPAILVPIARTLAARLDTTNRMVCQRSRSSLDFLNAMDGDPRSCAAHFDNLADRLEPIPELEILARKARAFAKKAIKMREELEQTCRKVLGMDNPESDSIPL